MAGIITLVHGAARQTNSRGLNVAVEAARVGEQGGGLGILATEVPAMAARSIATAREINALIADSATCINDDGVLVAEADLRGGYDATHAAVLEVPLPVQLFGESHFPAIAL